MDPAFFDDIILAMNIRQGHHINSVDDRAIRKQNLKVAQARQKIPD